VAVEERTDAELVVLARSGDKDAFGQLIERYQSMAKRIAIAMVANENVVQDLVQEAMLQAYLCLEHLKDDRHFKNWLYGIVLNVCRSHIRDRKAVFFSLEAIAGGLHFDAIPFAGVAPDPQKIAEEQELYGLVLKAVNSLSPKNRTATLLFYKEQLSLHEIAALLGVSVAAVKGRLHKSRIQLREQLLPLYAESSPRATIEPRRSNMIEVKIADVIPQTEEDTQAYVVLLWDEASHRVLPIWVGRWEGESIALGLSETPTPRPMTYNFMANLLEAAGAELEEVWIESLREITFYAVVKLRSADKLREVDARPSDAIALALRMNSPIYVAQELLEQHGMHIPAQGKNQLGKGIESLREKREKQKRDDEERLSAARSRPEEVKEKAYQELIAFLLGSDIS
jgi:RNA polymerase sigma factor (sigma-70 family)